MHNPFSAPSATLQVDVVERFLRNIAEYIVIGVFGFLPIFFIPSVAAPLGYSKTFFVLGGLLIALIFYSLSLLRSGEFRLPAPLVLISLWGIVAMSLVSAVLSGDWRDAFIGNVFEVHTTAFVILVALTATVLNMASLTKNSVMRLYLLLTGSAVLLTVWHLVRLVIGADVFSFGVFNGDVSSPVGSWNDLGLLFGLIILLALVAFEQLPLTRWGKVFFATVVVLSLVMLGVVNFFAVWLVIGVVSLVSLMFSLSRDRLTAGVQVTAESLSIQSIALSATVFMTSLVFVIGGSAVGGAVSNLTGISYVEVRPSVEATVDIARSVYQENAFVGTGPNKFVDAWRMYRDQSINQTAFWSTNFQAGSGYVPTMFVTTGVFGAVAWVLFFVSLLYTGLRMLMRVDSTDSFWYFIGTSAFVASIYLWGMSIVYVPGVTILLLAGLFTGVVCMAYSANTPVYTATISVRANQRAGFILVGIVMILILAAASSLYYAGRHYASVLTYNTAIQTIADGIALDTVEQKIATAYATTQNDVYARQIAQYQLLRMQNLITVTEPTVTEQTQFQEAATNGINAAQLAIAQDATEPEGYVLLGNIYGILAIAGIAEASERAIAAYDQARQYDPTNPVYDLNAAQLQARTGNVEAAREAIAQALSRKSNYTEALALLTEIEVADGNVAGAIASNEALVALDPQNPGRYYQLGVLYTSAADALSATRAFERAVQLDPNYANARYFLALAYAEAGRTDDAIAQLEIVRDLNPENAIAADAIEALRAGVSVSDTATENTVAEPEVVRESGEAVIVTEEPDTSLVSPVNTIPGNAELNTATSTDRQ